MQADERGITSTRGRVLRLPVSLLVAGLAAALALLLLALLAGPLRAVRIPEYTAWHTLLEVLAVAMGLLVAVVAWYQASGRKALLPMAAGLLSAAVLDIAHFASFPGMPAWFGSHPLDQSIWFWFGGRLAVALGFLALLLPRRGGSAVAWAFAPLTLAMLWLGLAQPGTIPVFFVEGAGLTPLKIAIEWGLFAAYLLLALAMHRSRLLLRSDLVAAGLLVLAAGELFFTLYPTADGLANGIGHGYKVLGMGFFFRAAMLTQIVAPYVELQQAKQARERTATQLDDLIRGAPDGIVVVDAEGQVRTANPLAETLFGAPAGGLVGLPLERLVPPELRDRHRGHRERYREAPQVRPMSAAPALQAQRLDGSRFYVDISLSPVEWEGQSTTVAFVRDATTRVEQMLRLDWLAAHDPLTGLPNRWALARELGRRCAEGERGHCVLFDIDNLGRVNEALGHDTGDALLRAMALRLEQVVAAGDFLGRLEGDKFGVVCTDERCTGDRLASLLDQLNRPLDLEGGLRLEVSVTAGIARFPEDGQQAETLIQASEIAMVEAKRTQRRGVAAYDPQLQQRGREWLAIASRLPLALQRQEFRMVFQPRIALADGSLAGVEALMRWEGSSGAVPPARFIPVAEENGFILELGRWSIDATLAQVRRWLDGGLDPGQVGINLSTRQLADVELPQRLRRALALHRIEPARIQLEVTETAAMQNLDWALPRLQALAAEGVTLALDDFGTGYSSLAYLQRLPVQVIKIDLSFVQEIGQPGGEALLRSIIGLAHSLGKQLVAEGVETPAQADWLRAAGCEEGQGYLFSRPLEADQLPTYAHVLGLSHHSGSPVA